jgi:hypothetical protein
LTIPHPLDEDDELTFSVQAEIPLTQPIGFATNAIDPEADLIVDGEVQENQDDSSDDGSSGDGSDGDESSGDEESTP